MTDPEKATIGDLFRLMTEMRGEMGEMRTEMNTRFDDAAAEREAIRNVVDNDLAGQGQVMTLEGKLTDVQRTTRQNGKKIDKLAERMDRAGIPAE
ncbi:MAG: hypothetical protein OEU92_15460 [Alphaproteobacteria bacterium]|nr:hypothetical protein [Alphaproteobacteria bacterium]